MNFRFECVKLFGLLLVPNPLGPRSLRLPKCPGGGDVRGLSLDSWGTFVGGGGILCPLDVLIGLFSCSAVGPPPTADTASATPSSAATAAPPATPSQTTTHAATPGTTGSASRARKGHALPAGGSRAPTAQGTGQPQTAAAQPVPEATTAG